MVALDKFSIKSHRKIDEGVLHIGQSVDVPIDCGNHVSKALHELLLSAYDAGHLRGTREN